MEMNKEITELKPEKVFKYFAEILQIPRPSKKEGKIIAYLINWAEQRKLDVQKDEIGNVIIRKSATKGYETKPWVCLQSHMDMVCEKIAIKFLILKKTQLKLMLRMDG